MALQKGAWEVSTVGILCQVPSGLISAGMTGTEASSLPEPRPPPSNPLREGRSARDPEAHRGT